MNAVIEERKGKGKEGKGEEASIYFNSIYSYCTPYMYIDNLLGGMSFFLLPLHSFSSSRKQYNLL